MVAIKRLFVMLLLCVFGVGLFSAPADAKGTKAARISQVEKQIDQLEKHKHKHASVIRFWNNKENRWTLYPRYKHLACWDKKLPLRGPERLCSNARADVRINAKQLRVVQKRIDKLEKRIEQLSAPRDTGYLSPEASIKLGQKMAALKGWTGDQWTCLTKLWGKYESGWYVKADNPNSDAYGIPQALPGSKMGPGWLTSAYVQIKWGLGYIAGRFGSPCQALAFRLSKGWY